MQIVGTIQWRLFHFWWHWKYAIEIELQFSGEIMRAVKLLKCKNTFFSNYSLLFVYVNIIMFKLKFHYNSCLKFKNRLMMSISNYSICCVCVIQLSVGSIYLNAKFNVGGSVRSRNLIFCNHNMIFLFFYIFLNILGDAVDGVLVSF